MRGAEAEDAGAKSVRIAWLRVAATMATYTTHMGRLALLNILMAPTVVSETGDGLLVCTLRTSS